MKIVFVLLMLVLSSTVHAVTTDISSKISKLEFQGIFLGDFPSVEMICVRGLCPVGETGVGINTNSFVPPVYNQKTAITHLYGVKISTPAFSYFDNKMFQIMFEIQCLRENQQECIDAVWNGLDASYGLTAIENSDDKQRNTSSTVKAFITESGTLGFIVQSQGNKRKSFPFVKIFDETLMNMARKSLNPDYIPPKFSARDLLKSNKAKEANR